MNTPLIVDLDGSLIHADLLYESFARILFKRPWLLCMIPIWLATKGIAFTKAKLAEGICIDVTVLPYNQDLLAWLREEKDRGRTLYLCTGATRALAEKVAQHLGIFSEVLTGDMTNNLTGSKKARLLTERFGSGNFAYVGNEYIDLKIWRESHSAILVGHAARALSAKQLPDHVDIEARFEGHRLSPKVLLKAMRIHQWAKNALLFVPLFTAHKFTDPSALLSVGIAFLAFGLLASATYLLNDLSDLDADRAHWKKCLRPLAAATLSIKEGLALCGGLVVLSVLLALLLPLKFLFILLIYSIITLTYSFWFKRLQTVDIVVLASLYTVRLFAGAAAIAVVPSFWLLSFSMFIFLCLAIVKRISEIQKKRDKDPEAIQLTGRGYYINDLAVLMSLGSASGMVSILVFAMYVNSPEIIRLYQSPMLLWAICPIIGYWIIRVLIMTSRGEIDEDPISFAIKDRRSWIAGASAIITVVLAWATNLPL